MDNYQDRGRPAPLIARRRFLRAAGGMGAGLGMTGGVFASVGALNAQGMTEIRVQYDWLMGNGQIGDIAAQKLGYFTAEGLAVTFGPGGPNAQTVPPVLSGQAQFGQFSSTSQALVAYGAGRPIKVFACGYQYTPYAYISLPRSPIRTPQDLVGKTVALNPNGRFTLELILALHKIDPAKVRTVTMGADMTPLVAGQVDAVTGFLTNTKALSILGPDRIVMTAEDAGVTSYANTYFTSAENYERQKDVLLRFIRAVAKGWGWAFENRKAAVDIMCDAYPNLDREIEYATIDIVMNISFGSATREHGWGWFDDERIARQIALFESARGFQSRVPTVASVSTREILDATSGARPRFG
jgi:NitT/TauT family transport system substrate-binding protein